MTLTDSHLYRAALSRKLNGLDLSALQDKSVLISGATGMVGSCLTDLLMLWNESQEHPCSVFASSRRESSAKKRFSYCWDKPYFTFVEHDVSRPIVGFPNELNFLIHAASNADPANMARFPVDTLLSNVCGTSNLIEYGRTHGMKRFLYVSSGEMYGQPDENYDDFVEDYCGPIDHSQPRSCYPVGKRASEVLCQSYISQYGIDAVIVRPCHLFGPTMTGTDSRAVSEFLKSAAAGEDIILKSAGSVERSQCYVLDAAKALLCVLLSGECGQAYNIADPNYQMRIREFAQRAAEAGGACLRFEKPSDLESSGYSKVGRAVLDASKLKSLGWEPDHSTDAIRETVAILREIREE